MILNTFLLVLFLYFLPILTTLEIVIFLGDFTLFQEKKQQYLKLLLKLAGETRVNNERWLSRISFELSKTLACISHHTDIGHTRTQLSSWFNPVCVTKMCVLAACSPVRLFHVFLQKQLSRGRRVYFAAGAGLSWYSTSLAAVDTNLLCGGLSSLAQDLLTPSVTVVAWHAPEVIRHAVISWTYFLPT